MTFYQDPPKLNHPWDSDRILKSYLKEVLPEGMFFEMELDLKRLADRVLQELEPLAQVAEKEVPIHVTYNPWGKRIDEIQVSSAWKRLHQIAAEEGIVAAGYERKFGEFSRLYQFAKLYLYHPSSAIYSCPLAMTDGAARVIELFGSKEMKERVYRHLTSRNPDDFWTCGQWMTERSGGSDVSGTSTMAKLAGDHFRLYGFKWFTSATTSQAAMTLARIEGDEKLSLFFLELRNKTGELQHIQINRLKEKMGTRALPTAELTMSGTPAQLVGERGKGVKTISTLFNITRLYNACCAVGYMQRGLSLLKDYSGKRIAFGKPLLQHALHAQTLADLQVRFEASFLMTFHAAALLGKEESHQTSEAEAGTLRLLIPLVKLYTAKEGVAIVSEVIEGFGGAGYVEDTGLPQILRNAQVLTIWEGTTNVLSQDVIRAIRKENAGIFFVSDVSERLKRLKHPEASRLGTEIDQCLLHVSNDLKMTKSEDLLTSSARMLAFNLSRIYCASLMLELAEKEIQRGSMTGLIAAKRFVQLGIYHKRELSDRDLSEALELLKM